MPSVILAGTSTNTALSLTSDTSGELQIQTNNGSTTAMTLTTAGLVGIGTSSPSSSLVVAGSATGSPAVDGVHVGTQSGFATLELCGTSGTGSFIDFTQSGTDFNGRILYNNSTSTMQMFNQASGSLLLGTNNSERMRIDSSGDVAIGTSSPNGRLAVTYSSALTDFFGGPATVQLQNTNTTANAGTFILNRDNSGNGNAFIGFKNIDQNYSSAIVFGTSTAGAANYGERMRIDADGDLGVGTNNPQYRIDVQATTGEQIARFRATTTTNQSYITISNAGTMYVGLDNSTGSAITNSAYAPFVYSSTDAPMSFFTNAARTVTFQQNGAVTLKGATQTSSGTGITFPATQSASSDANTLDDYEEGTWTPVDTSGASLTLAQKDGTYIKIGRQVTAWAFINYPSTADASNAQIGGLPFTASSVDSVQGGGMIGFSNETTLSSVFLDRGNTVFDFRNSAGTRITNVTLSTDSVYVAVTYFVS